MVGRLVPRSLRAGIWTAILCQESQVPEWLQLQDARLQEIYPSVRKGIRKDCHDAWVALSKDDLVDEKVVDSLVGFVSRLVFHFRRSYDVLLSNLAAVVCWVCEMDLEKSARVIDALNKRWGGHAGDWSSTGLGAASVAVGIGGAAWSARTVPLAALRRQRLVRKLVLYHDPELGAALEAVPNWFVDPCQYHIKDEDNSEETLLTLPRILDTTNALAAQTAHGGIPSASLFGAWSPLSGTGSPRAGALVLELWDSALLVGKSPQLMSFFVACSTLMVLRSKLLAAPSAAARQGVIGSALEAVSQDPAMIQRMVALAESLLNDTPDEMQEWLGEEELLLEVPSSHELNAFDAERVQQKLEERNKIVEAEKKTEELEAQAQEEGEPGVQDEQLLEDSTVAVVEQPAVDANGEASKESNSTAESGKEASSTTTTTTSTAAAAAAPTMSTRAGWMASALRKRAQDLKTALTTTAGSSSSSSPDLSGFNLSRRLVEFNGDASEPLGLGLVKGRHGLEVASVEPDSIADRTGLVHPGDIVMSLNGLLVIGLSALDAEALITLQERPVYMVVAVLCPKTDQEDEQQGPVAAKSRCAGLEERIADYYARYNRDKASDVGRILAIYSHRESVLLEELAFKYLDHVKGDPYYWPLSLFCPPVDPHQVVRSIVNKQDDKKADSPHRRPGSKKLFLIDARSQRTIANTGRFPTSYVVDAMALSSDAQAQTELRDIFLPMRGDMQVAILGNGSDTLVQEFNPRRARLLREKDRRAVDTCAVFLLQLGCPLVGVVEGGFLGCYMAIKELGFELEDCLVNVGNGSTLQKYDAFIRYRKASPTAVAQFQASKARNSKTFRDVRSETAASFSGLAPIAEETASVASKVSTMFGNVWGAKATTSTAGVMPNLSEATAEDSPSPEATANAATDTAAAPSSTATTYVSSFSSFLTSRASSSSSANSTAEKDPGDAAKDAEPDLAEKAPQEQEEDSPAAAPTSTTSTSSWGSAWSSRFKAKLQSVDTAGLSNKLRSSMNQAYNTASQKLATVSLNATTSEDQTEKPEDPAVLEYIATLGKEDLASIVEMGNGAKVFECEKKKQDARVKRWLVVTRDRFLVLEPHKSEKQMGLVKSTRSLKLVERMRYPNNDPSSITLFFNKGQAESQKNTYHFDTNAKAFTKALMLACARYNSRNAPPTPQQPEHSQTEKAVPEGNNGNASLVDDEDGDAI